MSKPTIVLIPGAWHTPAHFELFLQQLHDAGYPTGSKQLPSVGSADPKNQSGNDVILIMHSYGDSPGGAAAKGLSKAERTASGQKGGITGLIFMCAFLSNEGAPSKASYLDRGLIRGFISMQEETGQIDADTPESVFYNNVDDSLVKTAIDRLKQQALSALNSPGPLLHGLMSMMVSMSGLEWHELDPEDAGHSPFLSSAGPMIKFINERANEWVN
ncbi:hypothetical protein EDB80DRAFT_753585 [Ilyonectria destructans]|nr:hypothetical protein EDB80DRAFT_753585 [Ilyonectria destructans]